MSNTSESLHKVQRLTVPRWVSTWRVPKSPLSPAARRERLLAHASGVGAAGIPLVVEKISSLALFVNPQPCPLSAQNKVWLLEGEYGSVLIQNTGPMLLQSDWLDTPVKIPWGPEVSETLQLSTQKLEPLTLLALNTGIQLTLLSTAVCRIPPPPDKDLTTLALPPKHWFLPQIENIDLTVLALLTQDATPTEFWRTCERLQSSWLQYFVPETFDMPPGRLPVPLSASLSVRASHLRDSPIILPPALFMSDRRSDIRAFLEDYQRLPLDPVELDAKKPHTVWVPRLDRDVPLLVPTRLSLTEEALAPLRLLATNSGLAVIDWTHCMPIQQTSWGYETSFSGFDPLFMDRIVALNGGPPEPGCDPPAKELLHVFDEMAVRSPAFAPSPLLVRELSKLLAQEATDRLICLHEPKASRFRIEVRSMSRRAYTKLLGFISTRIPQERQCAFLATYARLPTEKDLKKLSDPPVKVSETRTR